MSANGKAVATVEEKQTLPAIPEDAQEKGYLGLIESIKAEGWGADAIGSVLDGYERVLDRAAEGEFNRAMSALRKELPAVVRNKSNSQTHSKYADLEAIKKVVDPLLVKHGFYDRYEDDYPADGVIGVTCEIVHEKGHSKRNRVQFTRDDKGIAGKTNKTPLHGDASAMTYGQRLALCRALGIRIAVDDDGNAAGAQTITEEQIEELQDLIQRTDTDIRAFCEHCEIESLPELNASEFRSAKILLKAKLKEKK